MKEIKPGPMLIGVFFFALALLALIFSVRPPFSIAQTLNQLAYLPLILNSPEVTPTVTHTSTASPSVTASAVPTTPAPTATSSSGTVVPPSATPSVTPGPSHTPTPSRTPTFTSTPSHTPTIIPETITPSATPVTPPPGMIYIDRHSVALFDQIPQQYLDAAANMNMFYMDRSVGGNISYGLSCLHEPWEAAPYPCKIYNHPAPEFSVDISEVSWEGTYDRSNWTYEFWPSDCGTWSQKVECFMNRAVQVMNQYEVISFQFSYLEVTQGSTIDDLPGGFFYDNPDLFDVYDLEVFEAQYPDEIYIYWTTSLARSIGSPEAESFNEQMRQYAIANNKILFDVADILSHDPDGDPCYDNRDGIPYSAPGQFENHPDDGLDIPALCQHYTSEADGGHLGSPSAGMIRVAKAFWVLMAQIAGWDPGQ